MSLEAIRAKQTPGSCPNCGQSTFRVTTKQTGNRAVIDIECLICGWGKAVRVAMPVREGGYRDTDYKTDLSE